MLSCMLKNVSSFGAIFLWIVSFRKWLFVLEKVQKLGILFFKCLFSGAGLWLGAAQTGPVQNSYFSVIKSNVVRFQNDCLRNRIGVTGADIGVGVIGVISLTPESRHH